MIFLGVLQMSSDILQPLIDSDITKVDTGIGIKADEIEIIEGDIDKNVLNGTDKNDHIYGMDGDDEVKAEKGDDWLYGGNGNDKLWGNEGNDHLYGEEGKDRLFGGKGNDVIDGGKGDDQLGGQDGDDEVKGQDGHDWLYGGNGNDKLWGNEGDDHLYGGQGKDRLFGGKGNDVIDGGKGDDHIDLGSGDYDTLVLALDNGYDHVWNFKPGKDKIQLKDGLTYFDLEILPQGNGDKHTLIKINKPGTPHHGKSIASLRNVHSSKVDITHFKFDFLSEIRSLDGTGNGKLGGVVGEFYRRVGEANYAGGIPGKMVEGPEPRYISNRIFDDEHINLFSENRLSHLVFGWGQFLDHTFGLAQGGGDSIGIRFDHDDVAEEFLKDQLDFDTIPFTRDQSFGGEIKNTVSSFIDGWAIYGGTNKRLDWLRIGSKDGDPTNNSAYLELPEGHLPTASYLAQQYPNAKHPVPNMDLMSRLRENPGDAAVAGDIRANENSALTGLHTLFAREHNRIVSLLPKDMDNELKFQIARKVVIAEQQYITYNEFLPTVGIKLDQYKGFDQKVDPSLTNEFATVGYRAHSMVHGDFDFPIRNLSDADLKMLEDQGALRDGDQVEVPGNTQNGNPSVIKKVGLGASFEGFVEVNYNNDDTIDNQLRSILFERPHFERDPEFTDGPPIARLFRSVLDLGAIDVQRGRDHGMPFYNDMREDYGLSRAKNFYDITEENIDEIKAKLDDLDLFEVDGTPITGDSLITKADLIDTTNDDFMDWLAVFDRNGDLVADARDIKELLDQNMEVEGITAIRRSTLAARLDLIYGHVDKVDAFTGMVSEKHVKNSEFGELQHKIWKDQFTALRDGDRFFHLSDQEQGDLLEIKEHFGIDYKHNLGDIIAYNTDLDRGALEKNVFISRAEEQEPLPETEVETDIV